MTQLPIILPIFHINRCKELTLECVLLGLFSQDCSNLALIPCLYNRVQQVPQAEMVLMVPLALLVPLAILVPLAPLASLVLVGNLLLSILTKEFHLAQVQWA